MDPAALETFLASMPPRYRRGEDPSAQAEHADIALGRGTRAAAVGRFRSLRRPGPALCVVADDRPGLLATISAALVEHGLDVLEGEAYTRRRADGRGEAVDLFWLRIDDRRLEEGVVEGLEQTLIELLTRRRDSKPAPAVAGRPGSETTVRFIEGEDGALTTLEIETDDRSGLLLAVTTALFAERLQIVGSQVSTQGARVRDRFEITELDGTPIRPERRLAIQVAIISAVQPV